MPLSTSILFSAQLEPDSDTIAEDAYQSQCADRAYEQSLTFRFSVSQPQIFTHIVTLINRRTEDEKSLTIETLSDRFADVMREITYQKVMQDLLGYEVFEILDCNPPF